MRYGIGHIETRIVASVTGLLLLIALIGMAPRPAQAKQPLRIMALGDSLTAGYGLSAKDSFPAQLERALNQAGIAARVLNAGVSGDTTAGGLARLDWALADNPQLVIVALGANDSLRAVDPEVTRANLAAILQKLRTRGLSVLLAGMYAPPNLGQDYQASFDSIYPELAAQHDVLLYPFFLEGVAAEPDLNQSDGIHPNANGVAVIVRNILPYVVRLIEGSGS